jgi:Rad3-related DNA helicase
VAKASGGCGFRCKEDKAMDTFVSAIAENVMDIEELVKSGSRRAVCPYYAARNAARAADIVVVPYTCLIHRCV